MIILVDFDDVLFNTKKFKEDLQSLFFKHGISKDTFEYYYHNPKQNKTLKTYDPWNHLELIKKGEAMDARLIRKDLDNFMSDTNPYLFEDSVDFLKAFRENFVCILSYGEMNFQKMKIGECKAGEYCKEIRITNGLKSGEIEKIFKELNKDERVYFIDDRIEQLEDVKRKFPFVVTIFMRRSEGRYCDEPNEYCDFQVANLKEVEKIIKSLE